MDYELLFNDEIIEYEIKDGIVQVPKDDYVHIKTVLSIKNEAAQKEAEYFAWRWGRDKDIPKELSCKIFCGDENSLRLIRKYRGLSQGVLAAKAGVSKTMISHMENGRKQASAKTIKKLAYALNVDMEDLV